MAFSKSLKTFSTIQDMTIYIKQREHRYNHPISFDIYDYLITSFIQISSLKNECITPIHPFILHTLYHLKYKLGINVQVYLDTSNGISYMYKLYKLKWNWKNNSYYIIYRICTYLIQMKRILRMNKKHPNPKSWSSHHYLDNFISYLLNLHSCKRDNKHKRSGWRLKCMHLRRIWKLLFELALGKPRN